MGFWDFLFHPKPAPTPPGVEGNTVYHQPDGRVIFSEVGGYKYQVNPKLSSGIGNLSLINPFELSALYPLWGGPGTPVPQPWIVVAGSPPIVVEQVLTQVGLGGSDILTGQLVTQQLLSVSENTNAIGGSS